MLRILIVLACFLGLATADDVLLKGGTRLSGTVLHHGKERVRLLTAEGSELRIAAGDVLSVVRDKDAPGPGEWMRFRRGKRFGGALQVAVVHMLSRDGVRVDLLSAVHIADPAYWSVIRRHLETTEVVLFELVKPKGVTVPDLLNRARQQRDESRSPVSKLQKKMARWFALEFQLDAINYDRPHFVHADLETGRGPRKRDEPSFGDEPAGGADDEVAAEDVPDELEKLKALIEMAEPMLEKLMGDGDDPKAVKLRQHYKNLSARLLGTLGNHAAVLFGPKLRDTLLTKRNKIVLAKLGALPPRHRSVTIFYGAAHMADIEARLRERGYTRAGGRWVTAWNIPD